MLRRCILILGIVIFLSEGKVFSEDYSLEKTVLESGESSRNFQEKLGHLRNDLQRPSDSQRQKEIIKGFNHIQKESIFKKNRLVEGLDDRLKSFGNKYKKLATAEKEKNEKLNCSKELIEKLRKNILKLKQENKVLNKSLIILKNKEKRNNAKLKSYEDEIAELKKTIQFQEKQLLDKERMIKTFGEKVNSLTKNNEELSDRNNQLEKEIEILKDELGNIYFTLGTIYTQEKLYKDAINSYEKSLKYNPNLAQNYYNLALLYEYVEEDTKKALFHLEKYLKLEKEEKKKKKAKELIEMLSTDESK